MINLRGPMVDASTPISRDVARGIRAAGKLGVIRCYAFASAAWAEPTRAELDGLLAEGLAVGLYAFWRAAGHSAETGRADAARQLALLDALAWPRDVPGWVDLECTTTPSAEDARAYAAALSEAYAAAGRVRAAYYDRSFALSGARLDGLFDLWWQSGARAELAPGVWLPSAYVLRQDPRQTMVAGHPVDLDEAEGAPMVAPVGGDVMPDLSFRHVFPGETAAERCVRIAMHIADLGKGSRDLLEPGARTVPWTCMMTLRAIFYHAHLRPEDGWRVITVDGETFGGDYGPKIGSGFDQRILDHWGKKHGGLGGAGTPWPIEQALVFCTGQHVGFVCHVRERAPGVYDLFTVEGGQVDGAIGKGTRSWTGGPGEEPQPIVIDDRRADDHAQRFMRTWTRDVYGKVPGMLSVAALAAPGILTAPAMTAEEKALREAEERDNAVNATRTTVLEERAVLEVPSE